MTVDNIIKAVRCCIDEEAVNPSGLADVSAYDFDQGTHTDLGLMNNIIMNKIPAALRWVCLYAPAEQLSGGGSTGETEGETSNTINIIEEETFTTVTNNTITPDKTLIRVIRVKGNKWHRAILGDSLIKEDSDEYLALNDTNGATATEDRPQAALVNTREKKVEVWPATGNTIRLTYIRAITAEDIASMTTETDIGVPTLVETSFIYYLAYLLCSAYGDERAKSMFDIATMNLGRTDDKQRQ